HDRARLRTADVLQRGRPPIWRLPLAFSEYRRDDGFRNKQRCLCTANHPRGTGFLRWFGYVPRRLWLIAAGTIEALGCAAAPKTLKKVDNWNEHRTERWEAVGVGLAGLQHPHAAYPSGARHLAGAAPALEGGSSCPDR